MWLRQASGSSLRDSFGSILPAPLHPSLPSPVASESSCWFSSWSQITASNADAVLLFPHILDRERVRARMRTKLLPQSQTIFISELPTNSLLADRQT